MRDCCVPENTFTGRIARTYDTTSQEMFRPEVLDPAVDFLADLAGDGEALELAIGTGRVALPLSQRGVRVHGIELSEDMVAQLRTKPDADAIGVTIGDFVTTKVNRSFRLAYLVYNTIMNVTTQAEQVDTFRNVAGHLEPGGCFVIEVVIPALQRVPIGAKYRVFHATPSHIGFEDFDIATQISYSHHWFEVDGQLEKFSAPYRYVWPSELDLMAQLAGMTLRERWGSWKRDPFTSDSRWQIAVWEKPA